MPIKLLKIGPVLSIRADDNYRPNMRDAIYTDCDSGAVWLISEELRQELMKKFPTIMAMAELIEKERDQLRRELKKLNKELKRHQKHLNGR